MTNRQRHAICAAFHLSHHRITPFERLAFAKIAPRPLQPRLTLDQL